MVIKINILFSNKKKNKVNHLKIINIRIRKKWSKIKDQNIKNRKIINSNYRKMKVIKE